MNATVRASVVIVTFDHRDRIGRCLSALLATISERDEVVVLDNASADGTADAVAGYVPRVRLVRSASNLGFAIGCNLAARATTGRYLVFLNPDTEPRAGWLDGLIAVLDSVADAGLVGPKMLQARDPDRIDTLGLNVNISGIPTSRGWGDRASCHVSLEEVGAVSGACFATRRSLFDDLGGFDERIFLYLEDLDLGMRARAAGYRCFITPGSEVVHEHPAGIWAKKFFYIERNRWWIILKTYSWRTIFGLVPALIVAEMVAWGFAIVSGPPHVIAKARSWLDLLRWLPALPRARRDLGRDRRVSDRMLLKLHDARLPFAQAATGPLARAGETLTTLLFSAARLFMEAVIE